MPAKKGYLAVLFLFLTLGMAAPLAAAAPQKKFPTTFKTALAAGRIYRFTFTIWDAPTAGTQIPWSEGPVACIVNPDQSIHHLVGSRRALPALDFTAQYWVQAQTGTTRYRVPLPAAAYAFWSEQVNTTQLDARYVQQGQANAVTATMIADGQVGSAKIDTSGGAAGQVLAVDPLGGAAWRSPALVAHTHDGAAIISGTVAEERIGGAIARDAEILPAVLAGDGEGSGLDSDTVDGLHATGFASSSHTHGASHVELAGDQTITGLKTFEPAAGNVPFAVGATKNAMVANLYAARAGRADTAGNADSLGGQSLADLDARYETIPFSPAGEVSGYFLATVDGGARQYAFPTSIAIGADGLPVIAVRELPSADLTVAKCGNIACSAGNIVTTVDSTGNVGWYASIAIGADGLPVISYQDIGLGVLKVAKCGNTACSAGNTLLTVDSSGTVGKYTSIVIGADGLPVISYGDGGSGDLKVVKCGDARCQGGNTITTVDSGGLVGEYTSITIGADGFPVISYLDYASYDLKVAKCGNAACSSGNTITTVDSTGNVGFHSSIAVGNDGLPVVSYQAASPVWELKVAKCGNGACSSGNTITAIGPPYYHCVSYTSITVGTDGLPVISYQDCTANNEQLRVAKCGNAACSAGNTTTYLESSDSIGAGTSITIGIDGLPIFSYNDGLGNLKVAKGFSRPLGRR